MFNDNIKWGYPMYSRDVNFITYSTISRHQTFCQIRVSSVKINVCDNCDFKPNFQYSIPASPSIDQYTIMKVYLISVVCIDIHTRMLIIQLGLWLDWGDGLPYNISLKQLVSGFQICDHVHGDLISGGGVIFLNFSRHSDGIIFISILYILFYIWFLMYPCL